MSLVDTIKNLDEKSCVIDTLLKEVSKHECKDCGKCVFGYEGACQFEMILKDISERKAHDNDKELLKDLSETMQNQVLCEKGYDLAQAMLLALSTHSEEFDDHIAKKQCKAGVCKKFMTVHILASKCTGCGDCLDVCEEDAILGKDKFVHVIKNDECTLCGKCVEACDEKAIVYAGAIKPRCPKMPIPCLKK